MDISVTDVVVKHFVFQAQRITDMPGEEGFVRSLATTDLEYLFAED
jgi:hypothetical protein